MCALSSVIMFCFSITVITGNLECWLLKLAAFYHILWTGMSQVCENNDQKSYECPELQNKKLQIHSENSSHFMKISSYKIKYKFWPKCWTFQIMQVKASIIQQMIWLSLVYDKKCKWIWVGMCCFPSVSTQLTLLLVKRRNIIKDVFIYSTYLHELKKWTL